MAIGTTAAIIGSAAIGAGASAMASSKNSKAISQASRDTQAGNQQAIAAQERARSENLALQRPLYDAGMPAVNARNALLGLGGPQMQQQPSALAQYGQMPASYGYGIGDGQLGMGTQGIGHRPAYQNAMGRPGQQATAMPQGNPGQSQQNAFDAFRNSTGYKFRFDQGMNALNGGWAGAGTLQSGAAMKSALEYGQGMGSAEFGNYWNMLGEQQNLTSGAANAMSGVNTTYANNAGSLAVNAGNQQAALAMQRGQNAGNTIGAIGSSFGNALGYMAMPQGAASAGGASPYAIPATTPSWAPRGF